MRDLTAVQIDEKLKWLQRATCRIQELETFHISEPILSYYVGFLLNRADDGWQRFIEGITALLYSFPTMTIDAGRLGEMLTQLLTVMALDQVLFGRLSGPLTVSKFKTETTSAASWSNRSGQSARALITWTEHHRSSDAASCKTDRRGEAF